MLKMKNKRQLCFLTPYEKLKRKTLSIAMVMLVTSIMFIDVVNERTASNQNWLAVFIQNLHLMLPWGLVYLIAFRYRDLLKVFAPLYMALVILVSTGFLTFNHFSQSQNFQDKFDKEISNIINDQINSFGNKGLLSQRHPQTYSEDEYGSFAIYLNKCKKVLSYSEEEQRAILQAFNEVEFNEFFTKKVLLNFRNIVAKKKQLERLLLFLNESANRTERVYSEWITWILTSPEINELTRKDLKKITSGSAEEKKFFRQEPYRINKSIVQQFIMALDFLLKTYGSYTMEEGGQVVFFNEENQLAWAFYGEIIENLLKEQEDFDLLRQKKLGNFAANPNK